MNNCLMCESHVKRFILEKVKALRPSWKATRVSADAVSKIDAKVRNIIVNAVKSHPTRGKTFKYV